ncbi:MAG: gamma-glutamyl-phosphate reductase, partial [Ectothiorhodospira sp.]
MEAMGQKARAASRVLARAETGAKDRALRAVAGLIEQRGETLLAENRRDLEAGEQAGLDAALLDRLAFTPERLATMAEGLRQIAALPDPVGAISDLNYRPSGIQVGRMRVPL